MKVKVEITGMILKNNDIMPCTYQFEQHVPKFDDIIEMNIEIVRD